MQGQAQPPSAALEIQLYHGPHWRLPFLAKIRPEGQQLLQPNYRVFFALTRKPFGSDLAPPKEIMQTVEVLGVAKRFEYAIRLGPLALVIGNVGGGKFIALRWAASRLHHPGIRSSGSPPHRAPSWSSTGKSASNSKWTPPVSQRPSSPSSSENRSWKSPRTARKNPSSSSMEPPSSGVKSWPSCTPSLSFREISSQSCPSA
ncbi:hypothetical protein DFAR_1260037 [Desulfarculales bacterium]